MKSWLIYTVSKSTPYDLHGSRLPLTTALHPPAIKKALPGLINIPPGEFFCGQGDQAVCSG